jgi:pSer/pThr/pTyr-binding forkhead associated (FHA) protein
VITVSLLHPTQAVPTQRWIFDSESTVRIGRATDNDVVLYSAVVSRYHVELRQNKLGWRVVNISSNGTYSCDGHPLSKVVATDGMVFRLATSGPRIQVNLGSVVRPSEPVQIDEFSTSDEPTEIGIG